MLTTVARRFLGALEPLVSQIFFAPEAIEEFDAIGVDAFSAYFVSRSAPMGRATPAAVASAFYNFSPALVAQLLNWGDATPEQVRETRLRAARRTYERLLPEAEGGPVPDVSEAVDLLRVAAAACRPEGRVLFAAHAGEAWPDDPLAGLWHGCNLLREYRGDGHIAVLVRNEVDAVEALVMHIAYVQIKPGFYFRSRGWAPEEYQAAEERLRARGFLEEGLTLSDAGSKFREMLEMETDKLGLAPFAALGPDRSERLHDLLRPLAERVVQRGGLPGGAPKMAGGAWEH